jgi:hypothetical protein
MPLDGDPKINRAIVLTIALLRRPLFRAAGKKSIPRMGSSFARTQVDPPSGHTKSDLVISPLFAMLWISRPV